MHLVIEKNGSEKMHVTKTPAQVSPVILPSTQTTKKIIFPKTTGFKWGIQSTFWITSVGCFGKILLGWFNKVSFYNRQALDEVINYRADGTPLITVSNHASMFDDPGLIATMVGRKTLVNQKKMRWSLAAREICFGNSLTSYVCHYGKIIPITRGEGIYQQGMNYAVEKLNKGDWVHVFPDGKVTLDEIRLKWGVGRMILDCKKTPVVLPFYHIGMHEFLPCQKDFYIPFLGLVPLPRLRQKITVLYGEPIPVRDVIKKCRAGEVNETTARILLTNRIQESFRKLRRTAENLHTNRGFKVS